MELIKLVLVITVAGMIAACSSVAQQTTQAPSYQDAMDAFDNGDYASAAELLGQLEFSSIPQSKIHNAQFSLLVSQYRLERYQLAINSADRFIQAQPQSQVMDQALYLRADSHYQLYQAAPEHIAAAHDAVRDFSAFLSRFATSPHATDARLKHGQLRRHLALYELNAAQNRYNDGDYAAAANRARYVLENYKETDAIPGALKILAKAYDRLGLANQAANTREILTTNFGQPSPAANAADSPAAPQAIEPQAMTAKETAPQKPVSQPPQPALAASAKPAEPIPAQHGWIIQLASFKQADNAQRLNKRLQQAGFNSFVSSRGNYHRVIVGSESQRSAIETLLATLQQQFQLKGIIKSASAIQTAKR